MCWTYESVQLILNKTKPLESLEMNGNAIMLTQAQFLQLNTSKTGLFNSIQISIHSEAIMSPKRVIHIGLNNHESKTSPRLHLQTFGLLHQTTTHSLGSSELRRSERC